MKFGLPSFRRIKKEKGEASFARGAKLKENRLKCNLCAKVFRAYSVFNRFCRSCKESSELFRFHDTVPACT